MVKEVLFLAPEKCSRFRYASSATRSMVNNCYCMIAGAGKSSMLDCLFMRPTGGRLQGSITLDDDVVTSARPGKFRMVSTYVPQVSNATSFDGGVLHA